jgi:RNA polymerase sigma-70 factor (ECF subfamily)
VTDPLASFTEHREVLFTIAYEMLGSAADAEDVVQESWLRWSEADIGQVRNSRAYLAQTAARLAAHGEAAARDVHRSVAAGAGRYVV